MFYSIKRYFFRRRAKKAARLLRYIDRKLLAKANRTQKRQFWREFAKDGSFRMDLLSFK